MTKRSTTAALMLAASTLALTALPLSAQEAATDEAVEGQAVEGQAVEGTATADTSTDAATATGEAATDDTMVAEEGTAVEGEAAAGTETEMAQDGTATEGAAAAGAETEVAQDDAATAGTETDVAQDDTATDDAAAAGTEVAQDAATTAPGEGTAAAEVAEAETAAVEGTVTADGGAVANPPETPNADMQAVLDQLAALGARPIEELSVEEARSQPTPADAVMAVMEERGTEMPAELAGILTRDITYPGADGSEIAARVYTPPEGEGPFPLIVYFHGGGWVIANIDVYDASARALAAGANAVVVSATYRQAPEVQFPAQHEDANAAYEWIVENSGQFNADAERLAIAGESAGGNLAMNVAIHARDAQLTQPDHILSVYPIATNDMTTPSYEAYADAAPLSRDGMMWFVENVFADPSEAADPRINLIGRDDLAGLPPVTIINAEIDPLQSEGEILAERLAAAGVTVEQMTYPGVTHEFFGMGTVVPQAQEAVDMATANLREAFGEGGAATADAAAEEVTDVEATAAEGADAATDAATDAGAAAATDAATDTGAAVEMEGTTEPAVEGEAGTTAQ
jgi:acetyl esterase/lipase